ncbi:MAG TPA: hypothetical protein VGP41_15255, partial [Candidatus Lustribacter sp.]|nr:hypothetical protein [Candidatus Lustribacter sp.]
LFAACAGSRAALPPPTFALERLDAAANGQAAKVPLALQLSVSTFATRATTLTVYAYPLPASGPLAAAPPSSMAGTFDVSPASPKCKKAGAVRTCTFSLRVPSGSLGIVATLTAAKATIAQAFTAGAGGASTKLSLVAGDGSIAQLTVLAPALKGRAFNVGVTALQTEAPAGESPVVMIDPRARPVVVRIYGPPGVVPSPQATVGGSGVTAPFRYSGASFDNAMTVTAVAGNASMTAQIFPQNGPPRACAPLQNTRAFDVPEPGALLGGFHLHASVAGITPVYLELDTGSTSFLISKSLVASAQPGQFIGPGQAANETLEPSGDIEYGHYYLTSVTLSMRKGKTLVTLGTTVPMEVLVVDKVCHKGGTCNPKGNSAYMGVGFGRPTPKPGQFLLKAPTENAFLQLRDVVTGKMHPGYVLRPNSLSIGVNRANAAGFSFTQLKPFEERPGDWRGPSACLRFNGGTYQCGSMVLDIGIHSMFITAATPTPLDLIQIVAPSERQPFLNYSFAYPVEPGATPPAPDPNSSPRPISFSSPGETYVNTGRYALAAANYLYDQGCGRVGFLAPGK